jgi:CRP-like cAMP-binding protein
MDDSRAAVLIKELEGMELFRDLASEEIRALIEGSRVARYNQEEPWLFRENDPSKGLYVVLRGEVEILKVDRAGSEYLLTVLPAGEFLGENSLLHNDPRSASARAKGEVMVLILSKDDYLRLMDARPAALAKLMLRMLSKMTDRLRLLDEHYVLTKGCLDRLKSFS